MAANTIASTSLPAAPLGPAEAVGGQLLEGVRGLQDLHQPEATDGAVVVVQLPVG